MRIPLFYLIWIIFLIITSPCSGSDSIIDLSTEEKAWIKENHTVRVRIGNSPPFMLTDGKVQGIAIDYLTHIFDANGIKIKYISDTEVTWPEALEYIKRHEVVDMVPTAKITEKRQKDMIFTDEYIFAPWVIFTRSDADFLCSIDDLKGKTVSVEEGYVMHQVLKQNYPGIRLKVVSASLNNFAQIPVKDLSTGLVDAYIGNLLSTTYTIQTKGYTNVKVAAPTPFDNHNQAMAIRSDWPELVSIINKTLASMTPEEHAAIRNKWLSIRYEYGIDKTYVLKWVLGVIGIALLIIGFVLIWNKRLKAEVILRKKSEDALKKNEYRYKSAQRMGKVGNWEYDLVTETFWGSDQAKKIYGFDPDSKQFTTDEVENCIPERERVHQALIDLIEKDKPYNLEFDIHPVSGSKMRTIRSNAEIIKDDSGAPLKVLGVIQDITDQKRAGQEKEKLEQELRQAQKMESIGNLAGGIAHDFNNILSSIIGFTELALDDVAEGTPLEDNLQEVNTAGKRARNLVKQILAFARQADEEVKPIQVHTIVKEVFQFIRSSIPTTIEIKQNIESNSFIMGNATQVHQILMNLCTNASHAMEDEGGILEITLNDVVVDRREKWKNMNLKQGNYLEIKVSDTGHGIAPDIIGSIFEPYFTTKGVGEGTGMGLALVHGIVETYGGKITVDSALGKGTVFTIYLPLTKKREDYQLYQKEKLPSGTERILLIDDELPIAKMGSQVLERLGYRVTVCTSSVEALELFRSKFDDFDLVITDMTMPNMTGDKLAMELISFRPNLPVILCTGYSKKISDETASEIGIKAIVYKPTGKADLAKTVRKVLDAAKG